MLVLRAYMKPWKKLLAAVVLNSIAPKGKLELVLIVLALILP